MPPALRNRPTLGTENELYFRAYRRLSRSRQVGMAGPLPIPVSEIHAYCQMFYINGIDERDRVLKFVTEMDIAYLEYLEKQKPDQKDKK